VLCKKVPRSVLALIVSLFAAVHAISRFAAKFSMIEALSVYQLRSIVLSPVLAQMYRFSSRRSSLDIRSSRLLVGVWYTGFCTACTAAAD
jgi:hypothetical protein